MFELPSVEECQSFMAKLNEGRVALGLEPIEKLDYDACEPNHTSNCLSARHLFVRPDQESANAAEARLGAHQGRLSIGTFTPNSPQEEQLFLLNGYKLSKDGGGYLDIPREILAVTRNFDALAGSVEGYDEVPYTRDEFKARLVEAGIA